MREVCVQGSWTGEVNMESSKITAQEGWQPGVSERNKARWGLDFTELGAIWIVTHFTDVSFVNILVTKNSSYMGFNFGLLWNT